MSDGDAPAPRRRPTYGLPGPTTPADGSAIAGPRAVGPGATGTGAAGTGAAAPQPGEDHGPLTGPLPATVTSAPTPRRGAQAPHSPVGGQPGTRRRRGLVPLLVGLALLLLVGPACGIGGVVWTMTSLSSDLSTGPTVLTDGGGEVEIGHNQMLILYVPAEDSGATCTVEGSSPGAVTAVPSSSSVTFADGSRWEQVAGAVATEDTTATISCTGTDSPGYLGPMDALGIAAPMLIGLILAVLTGLIGLVLTIVGIVMLVRSRRP